VGQTRKSERCNPRQRQRRERSVSPRCACAFACPPANAVVRFRVWLQLGLIDERASEADSAAIEWRGATARRGPAPGARTDAHSNAVLTQRAREWAAKEQLKQASRSRQQTREAGRAAAKRLRHSGSLLSALSTHSPTQSPSNPPRSSSGVAPYLCLRLAGVRLTRLGCALTTADDCRFRLLSTASIHQELS